MISHTFVHTCKCSYWARVTYTCLGERQRGFRRDGGLRITALQPEPPHTPRQFHTLICPTAWGGLTVLQLEG